MERDWYTRQIGPVEVDPLAAVPAKGLPAALEYVRTQLSPDTPPKDQRTILSEAARIGIAAEGQE